MFFILLFHSNTFWGETETTRSVYSIKIYKFLSGNFRKEDVVLIALGLTAVTNWNVLFTSHQVSWIGLLSWFQILSIGISSSEYGIHKFYNSKTYLHQQYSMQLTFLQLDFPWHEIYRNISKWLDLHFIEHCHWTQCVFILYTVSFSLCTVALLLSSVVNEVQSGTINLKQTMQICYESKSHIFFNSSNLAVQLIQLFILKHL